MKGVNALNLEPALRTREGAQTRVAEPEPDPVDPVAPQPKARRVQRYGAALEAVSGDEGTVETSLAAQARGTSLSVRSDAARAVRPAEQVTAAYADLDAQRNAELRVQLAQGLNKMVKGRGGVSGSAEAR